MEPTVVVAITSLLTCNIVEAAAAPSPAATRTGSNLQCTWYSGESMGAAETKMVEIEAFDRYLEGTKRGELL